MTGSINSVQSLSCVTPWTAAPQASLSITSSRSHPNPCPLSRWCPPTISSYVFPFSFCPLNLSQHQGLFKWVSSSHQLAKVLELQHQSFHEYSGLISFRIDWLDLLESLQGTLKSLLHLHSLKASILWHSTFFMVQLSQPNMTTGKTIALTIWTLSAKWCLCFLIHRLGLS